ncbi:hypothetical protein GCM10023080_050420 [Streptomyces pseudoechinosporeus]
MLGRSIGGRQQLDTLATYLCPQQLRAAGGSREHTDLTEQVMMSTEPAICTFCGRIANSCRPIHERGQLPGADPYGLCCEYCDAEVSELTGRLIRISRPGHKDWLAFDSDSDEELPRFWRRKARGAAIVTGLLGRLPPVTPSVTPSAAWITTLTESVFVPDEPCAHTHRESALADIAHRITDKIHDKDKTYSRRLGTVGAGVGIMLQKMINDLPCSQYIYLVDTEHSVHAFYWYSR